jgi:predicted transcriptional regulator
MDDTSNPRQELLTLTTEIVAAFVGNNTVATNDLPALVSSVFRSLSSVGQPEAEKPVAAPNPAVPIRKSITPDFLICLEDGARVKMLKRYLAKRYNLTPDQYRQRWGLRPDYPMVAPNYAARRSELAKSFGLGRKAALPPQRAPEPPSTAPQRRVGRRKKVA